MEIALLRAMPIGSGVEASLNVDGGVSRVRLLRKPADDFAGWDDPDAAVVVDATVTAARYVWLWPSALDETVENGATYHYRVYGYHAATAAWLASETRSIAVVPTATLYGPDPLTVVRDRLRVGLQTEIDAGRLKPSAGKIDVLTAPPQVEHTSWPVVSVHLDSDQSAERALGEITGTDAYDAADDSWEDGEGWLSRWNLSIVGWSLNPDERISVRKAIKKTILGNLSTFESAGMILPDLTMKDTEDFGTYGFPVYMTTGAFTCLAPAWLAGRTPAIDAAEIAETTDDTPIEYP